ncbi:MAG: hypothetical protein ILP23_04685 [Paludibacteraceae bacterium]|nr:hypothetical protein [Paludibacteraceae bacterium]
MNEYIEEYIETRKKELAAEALDEKQKLIKKLFKNQGEKEFKEENPEAYSRDYPLYDATVKKWYRLSIGDISDEDYAELLKWMPKTDNTPTEPKRKSISGWYYFAIIFIIIGLIGSFFAIAVGRDAGIIAGLSIGISVLILCSQIILLCKIERNTRTE